MFARSVKSRLPRRMRRFVQIFAARRCGKHRLLAKYEYKTQTIQRCDSLSQVSSIAIRLSWRESLQVLILTMGGSRGGTGVPTPPPLENHKLYWFYFIIFGVWMHLGMAECRIPFSGHCDLDLDL